RVEEAEKLKRPDMASLKKAVEKSKKPLKKIIPITVITMIIFWLMTLMRLLDYLNIIFDPVLNLIGLPGEASAALLAQFMHFSAGYTVVGSMVDTGVLTFGQALVTLILGSMIIITMIYLKYSVPLYLALFGKDGIRVAVIAYAASMTAKVICIGIVMAVFF
nr:nucleoside recognition protein [Methanomicrobiaceae archaeon]